MTTAKYILDSFTTNIKDIAETSAEDFIEQLYDDELGFVYSFEDESSLFIPHDECKPARIV